MWYFNEDRGQWRRFFSVRTRGVVEQKAGLFHYFFIERIDGDESARWLGTRTTLEDAQQACEQEWQELIQANLDFNFINNALNIGKE